MEKFDILRDIAERTGGDIYIGVVGAARVGKSTFIRKFMELLVLPNISDPNERQRAKDALPQAAGGRTIMTVEPKFVPDEGVEITLKDNIVMRIRMVDCTGYVVPGALGYEDEVGPRMVSTPWFEEPIPFHEAAEVGTRKVILDHSTIGLVVTTDGSITDIPRENYVEAEERVVGELKALGKPFVIILNSTDPFSEQTQALAGELETKYDVSVVPADCTELSLNDINVILEQVLYEFPVNEVNIALPPWVEGLEAKHWYRERIEEVVKGVVSTVKKLKDIDRAMTALKASNDVENVMLRSMNMGEGSASIELTAPESIYLRILGEIAGEKIGDKSDLLHLVRELSIDSREYRKVADGLKEVRETGYGVIQPTLGDLTFEEPELIRQGARFGVRLRASAPSIHLIRADIQTEVSPIIGTEAQCEELVKFILDQFEDDPKKIWQSGIFGKSMADLIKEGIQNKLQRMPENAQVKLQEALTKIVNEGGAGLICIIL